MGKAVRGTEGYAEQAEKLVAQWQAISFVDTHGVFLPLLPGATCRVLDIGAGIGTDAAAYASMGHQVLAVEPTDELRIAGMALHNSPRIEWLDDSLPELTTVMKRSERFEVVALMAVWMHLDAGERAIAMPRIVSAMSVDGLLIMSLRHGPVPAGRRMFAVSADETTSLAEQWGLRQVLLAEAGSVQAGNRASGVTWTRLAFVKDDQELTAI